MSNNDDISANKALGLIPTALCYHDGEAVPVVINAVQSKLGFAMVCTVCGDVHPLDRVTWHSADWLSKRFGWTVESLQT
jgi:hypothetical protein